MTQIIYSNDDNDNNQSVIIAEYVQDRVNGSLFSITLLLSCFCNQSH